MASAERAPGYLLDCNVGNSDLIPRRYSAGPKSHLSTLVVSLLVCIIPALSSAQTEADAAMDTTAVDSTAALEAASTPLPAVNVRAADTHNDGGGSITVTWDASPDDHKDGKVKLYRIMRAEAVDGQPGEFTEQLIQVFAPLSLLQSGAICSV